MKRIAFILLLIIAMCMPGIAKGEENPFLKDAKIKLANAKRIVIIPFADYMRDPFSIDNRRLLFSVRQGFESMGKLVIPDEDVWKVLKDMEIIKEDSKYKVSLEKQLKSYGFSKELAEYIEENDVKFRSEPYIPALTEEEISKIAKLFNADIVVRGCVVDYGVIDVSSASPLSNIIGGVAPFMTAQRIGIAIAAGSYIPSTDKEGVVQMTIYLHDGWNGRLIYGKSIFATYKPLFSNLQGRFVLLRGAVKRALDTFFSELKMEN